MNSSLPALGSSGSTIDRHPTGQLQVPFDHELVIARPGPRCGYPLIIAIHSSRDTEPFGTAAGGCRLARYVDPLVGLYDALRLSQGMSHTAAIAGRYLTGPDVGTSAADMQWVHQLTPFVGGFAGGGTTKATAVGVHACLSMAARPVFGSADLVGLRVLIVGLGVGELLARRLAQAGATLIVTDIDPGRKALASELGADWIDPEAAQRHDCDIGSMTRVQGLGDTASAVLRRVEVQRVSTLEAALRIADEQLAAAG